MIPFLKQPYPDELLYSCISRLARANVLSLTSFVNQYMNQPIREDRVFPYDVRAGLIELCDRLSIDAMEILLSMSTFPFESIFMTQGQQIRYVHNVFRSRDALNTSVNALFKKLRRCPACMQEDLACHGESYLRRSHQYSGVCTCYKHQCLLQEYDRKNNVWREVRMMDIPKETLAAYTTYAQAFSRAKAETNIIALKHIVLKRIKDNGWHSMQEFAKATEYWEHRSLLPDSLERFFYVKMGKAEHVQAEEMIPILMVLFPNVDELTQQIQKEPLLKRYVCESCEKEYITVPKAVEDGWECPVCNVNIEDTFQRLVKKIGKGEYTVESAFESLDKKLVFYHRSCGHKTEMKPRQFLFEERRCSCEYKITKAVARARIEANEGFKLITFHGTTKPVTLYREECNHKFTCDYHKFLLFPGCRRCKPKHMTARLYEQRVFALAGEEYSIVKGFADQKTKVVIKHNKCGGVHPYKPSAFLNGQRCGKCRPSYQWDEMFRLLLAYKEQFGHTVVLKRQCFMEQGLGHWCNRQRYLYKSGRLKKNREQQLIEIGFCFDPLDVEWKRRYEQYKRYIKEKGICKISRRFDYEGEHLGAWVETQQKNYKKGKLSEERALLMRALDADTFA